MDPPRNPGQHLAPGLGNPACHRPAAVPGKDQPPVSLAPAGTGLSDTAACWQVAFEVLRDGFLGDVGLDDITQTAGPCGAELSCSFEAEGCGLAAGRNGTWRRQSNSTGTTAGPVTDHTTGTTTGMGPGQPRCFPAVLSVLPACSECPAGTPHQPCPLSLCHTCPALHTVPRMSRRQYCTGLPNPGTPQTQSLPAPGLPNPGVVPKLGRLLDLGGKPSPSCPLVLPSRAG